MGAFAMAVRIDAFADRAAVEATMTRYLEALRSAPALPGETVMAPGDREWRVADERDVAGAPLDPATLAAFDALAERFSLAPPPVR